MLGSRIRVALWAAGVLVTSSLYGCFLLDAGQGSSLRAGFTLPSGDPELGKTAFVELKCHSCHRVSGVAFPEPTAHPPVPAVLGGRVLIEPTDGQLVTAIIHPSLEISARPLGFAKTGERSRMGDYTDSMTVRQLIDLVAFLHQVYLEPEKDYITGL